MSKMVCRGVGLLMAVLLITTASGCKGGKRFDVAVSIDSRSWAGTHGAILPSLEVDLVGINESEKGTWENYPIGKYFSPNDPLRRDADRKTLTFTNEDRETKVLSGKDPIWTSWIGKMFSKKRGKGARWLFLIANLPGVSADLPGDQDPRRVILPLKRSAWPIGTKQIDIVIKSSMAVTTTEQKAKKK